MGETNRITLFPWFIESFKGYLVFRIMVKPFSLVCKSFHGPPPLVSLASFYPPFQTIYLRNKWSGKGGKCLILY